ncbi:hypothetical protein P691DRAFT_765172 [Macrolepiota fuliginosa MF-IS2]|uniref:Uncharacterized protein n=1 Tax=Macrolepiota fuliginosa MF-IS2 TaxID=1400762 RepID=A0A9P5X433_9AGAR|nr:hypothetical protein P691DRAFT_765172 [Macrolepiota fuliginosa MF-IS2]
MHPDQVSTGMQHPGAQQPVISITNTPWERPAVGIENVRDNLGPNLARNENARKPDDHVFIYEWKTGRLKMKFSAPRTSVSCFSLGTFFLPSNTNTGTLEYRRIPCNTPEATPHQPFFTLALPQLRQDRTFGHMSCRAEPNPSTNSYYSPRPFYADPRHAIAVFKVTVRSGVRPELPVIFHHPHLSSTFVFFVHRISRLNRLVQFSGRASEDDEPPANPTADGVSPIVDGLQQRFSRPVGSRPQPMDAARVLVTERHDRAAKNQQDIRKVKGREAEWALRHQAVGQSGGSGGINRGEDGDYHEESVDILSESGEGGDMSNSSSTGLVEVERLAI